MPSVRRDHRIAVSCASVAVVVALLLVPAAMASPSADPVIADIQPREAYANELVTLIGQGFGAAPGQVTFAGVGGRRNRASTRQWSDTRIVAEVPYNTQPGEVIVRTADGRVSNGFPFSPPCWDRPVIHSIVPGRAMQCEVVKITGCGFGSFQYQQRLTFNGHDATGSVIGRWSETELLVPVPDNATSGPVIITGPRGQPSAGVPFTVVDDEPVWERLPSITTAKSSVRVELKLRTIPADPRHSPAIVPVAWTHDLPQASGAVTWRTEREFEISLGDSKGQSQGGPASHWLIRGQIWPEARAVAVQYSEHSTRVTKSSRDDMTVCELQGELAIVLPLVETHVGGTPPWNVWAPRFPFLLTGREVTELITKVSYHDKCHLADLAGNPIGPADSYVLDHVDETGYWFGHSAHGLELVFEGSGTNPCYGPKPPWQPRTDLVGQAYVMLPGAKWDPRAVLRAEVARLLVGTAEGYRQPLPGLPVVLSRRPAGASGIIELGRTVTDHDGYYRFWSVPITDSLHLDFRLENHESAPPAFVVTHGRADGAIAEAVTLRSGPFATMATWPNRRDTRFRAGAGLVNAPAAVLDDLAGIYAHSWQAWRTAAELALPLDMRSASGAPPEIRSFSPKAGVHWSGARMAGAHHGRLPGDADSPHVNIEPVHSHLTEFERPVNREYHEIGHHVMADLFDNAMPYYYVSTAISDSAHLGTLNPTTTDSWIEGFAEYFAAVVSHRSRITDRPELYPLGSQTVVNLDHNYKARSHWGSTPYTSVEEFAVASLLWDLADSRNDAKDVTLLGINQNLLNQWQVQLSTPLASPRWPPDAYYDRIALGHARVLRLIRDSDKLSAKHGLSSPNAPSGYDFIWDVRHLYDLLRAQGVGQTTVVTSPYGLNALDELFVAHGFFADTAPQNLVYDPGEVIGMTSNQAYTVIGTTIPARATRRSPAPPPTGHLTYSGRDTDIGTSIAITDFLVELEFDEPYSHLSYAYRAPAGSENRLALVPPEPLYPARIRVTAYGERHKSVAPFELAGDDYWYRAARSPGGEIAVHRFEMQLVPSQVFLPFLARTAAMADLPAMPKPLPPTPPDAAAMASELAKLINAERTAWGREPLAMQADLRRAAEWYAGDMAASGQYRPDHTDRQGRSMANRLKALGYGPEGHPRWQVAENIARGQPRAADVVRAWMASPRHRANILDDGLCEIGTAYGFAPADPYRHYWVADFGCRTAPEDETQPATPVATPRTPQPPGSPTATTTRSPIEPIPTTAVPSTPTATLQPDHGIQGRVTFAGVAAPGVFLVLRLIDGDQVTDVRLAQSWDEGHYAFADVPGLAAGQVYRVWFLNEDQNPERLSSWRGPAITAYREGQAVHGGDFDIANVALLWPEPNATVRLPAEFHWQRREFGAYSYRWLLYEEASGRLWQTGDLGDVGSYTLDRLPDGVSSGVDYWWLVRVYQGSDSYGTSRYMRRVRFDGGAAASPSPSPSPTATTGPTVLFSDDFCDPASGWPVGSSGGLTCGYLVSPQCGYFVRTLAAQQGGGVLSGRRVTGSGDHALTVSGRHVGPGRLGVLFGMTPARDRYYVYLIDSAGTYGLYRNDAGRWGVLATGSIGRAIDVQRGHSLRVECRGEAMRLLLDDLLLDVGRDPYPHQGAFGLYVESVQAGFEARFSRYTIEELR